jgi:ribosome-binding factor A
MSRLTRINELLMREVSDLLHTRYRDRSVTITITEVDITSDLRSARIYYSVLGSDKARNDAVKLLDEIKSELRTQVFKRVTLKYTPSFSFHYDDSTVRGNRTLAILDDLQASGEFKDPPPPTETPEETPEESEP